jgi:AmmeMemoRadiSam system protein B
MQSAVRRAAVAGTWYPGTPAGIAAEVDAYLAAATPAPVPGRLVALISPHAGLRYSGPVAAWGYGLLRGRRSLTVVLVGPSHHVAFDGIALYARGAWETPLGRAPVAEEIAQALLEAEPSVLDLADPHRDEHSLEMQLPFLQHLVPEVRIVPLLMGSQSREEVGALARALGQALASPPDDLLLVASSDLSHYQPARVANRLDALVTGDVERYDAEGLMGRLECSHGHACGGGPVVAVMKAARDLGADRAHVLRYGDSGDVAEGDKSRVVGYLSAALAATAVPA